MTVTLERPMSPACDSTLADDILYLVDNLDENIYSIVRDYQEIFCCEVILIDNNKNHWQIEIHGSGDIELLYQQYLPNGELKDISFSQLTTLPQFTASIGGTDE